MTPAPALLAPLLLALSVLTGPWQSSGPGGAAVRAVVQAPSDARVIYVASTAGVFRSSDGGFTFRDVTGEATGIAYLAVDPTDANALFALRGRDASPPHLFRTRDGGLHWQPLVSGFPTKFPFLRPSGLVIHPRQPNVVYVAGECEIDGFCDGAGVFRSTDSGDSFTRLAGPTWPHALSIDPVSPNTLYVGDSAKGDGRSDDGGVTWSFPRTPLPSGIVVTDPGNAERRYGITRSPLLDISNDAGATWTAGEAMLTSGETIPRWLSATLATDPASGRIFLGTTFGLSSPGGALFTSVGGEPWTQIKGASEAINSMLFDATTHALIIGTPAGLFRTADLGETWTEMVFARGTGVRDIVARGSLVALGANSIFRSDDQGRTWSAPSSAIRSTGASDRVASMDVDVNGDVFASLLLSGRVLKLPAGSTQWMELQVNPRIPVPMSAARVVADPNVSGTLYAITAVFFPPAIGVTRDGGTNWTPIPTPQDVNFIAVDPSNSSHLIIASSTDVLGSDNGGATWTTILSGVRRASNVAISPADSNVITLLGRTEFRGDAPFLVHRSVDGGSTWQTYASLSAFDLLGNENEIVADPRDARTIYARTRTRVIRSDDGGVSWRSISDTLGFAPTSFAVDDAFLHVGTERGVWELPLVTRRRAAERR